MASHSAILLIGTLFACILSQSLALGPYPINPNQVAVAGLSAGAFFATQYEIAYSSNLVGAAIFAGGPYYCAQDSLTTALTDCMSTSLFLSVSKLVTATKGFATDGYIDPLSSLATHKIFVYSGSLDTVVNPSVVKDLVTMYEDLGVPSGNIITEYTIPSEHCIPTDSYGNACYYLGSPFINDCQYDGAGEALQALYGTLNPKTSPIADNIISFNQAPFIPGGASPASISMGPTGYVYVPTACQKPGNASCSLVAVFHGCEQTVNDIGADFYTDAGFNDWAESNGIVVLYPQVQDTILTNPDGCYDWWGYTTSDYAFKTGPQMQTVYNMIQSLINGNSTATA